MTTYGLSAAGFGVKQQQTIISELQTALQSALGANINLSSAAVFGQLIGIFSEREALIWQLAEAVYSSQYPSGAEGTSVDNILALNNLRRLGATPTKTSPTNTLGVPGLLAKGTAGTVIPAGSIISVSGNPLVQFTTDAAMTIAAAVNAVQLISFTGGVPTTGNFTLQIQDPAGHTLTTSSLAWNASAATIQAAIVALHDVTSGNFPYTDVGVTGSIAGGLLTITFGANSPSIGQPASGAQPQNLFVVSASTVMAGSTVVNINPIQSVVGAPAEATGSATCTVNGPNVVPSGSLSVIGTPVSGWTSVTNPLDCITGSLIETDTEALARRNTLLAAQANGPLQAIAEKVQEVPGVVQAVGFENTSLAAQQVINFVGTPTGGNFQLVTPATLFSIGTTSGAIPFNAQATIQVLTFSGTPPSGSFTITIGSQTTGAIASTATAATVQAAIRALSGYGSVVVSGSFLTNFNIAFGLLTQLPITVANSLGGGVTITVIPSVQSELNALPGFDLATVSGTYSSSFLISFNGSLGGQPIGLFTIVNSLTGLTAPVTTGDTTNTSTAIANLLSGTGIFVGATISGTGIPANTTVVSLTINSMGVVTGLIMSNAATATNTGTTLTFGVSSLIFGRPGISFEIVVNDNNGEAQNPAIAQAIYDSKPAGIQSYGTVTTQIEDDFGNPFLVRFSRPTQVPIFVSIVLQTDLSVAQVPQFSVSSILTIQEDIVTIGNETPIGGLIVGFGTNGLIGAFNAVPGILSYTLFFGTSPNPTQNTNIQLSAEQVAQFETAQVIVSYS